MITKPHELPVEKLGGQRQAGNAYGNSRPDNEPPGNAAVGLAIFSRQLVNPE